MDSMGGMNTSLPGNSPAKPHNQTNDPPEQLLHAFKAAALSVTTLYKTAAADQNRARAEGYQEALDELLAFLDKENIGVGDGEGWTIRQWATERLVGGDPVVPNMESDEDVSEKPERDTSPLMHRSQSAHQATTTTSSTRTASPVRADSVPPVVGATNPPSFTSVPQSTFAFRSSHAYPQEADMTLSDLHLSDSRPLSESTTSSHTSNTSSTGLSNTRPSRANIRLNHSSNRHNTRVGGLTGRGAGQKRKINFGDFFDIGNVSHGRDGFGGGGKRTRFI